MIYTDFLVTRTRIVTILAYTVKNSPKHLTAGCKQQNYQAGIASMPRLFVVCVMNRKERNKQFSARMV